MADLRIGYDVFSGSSQAGTDSSVSGLVQVETNKKGLYRMGLERLSDNNFYNATTKAFVGSRPAEADELAFEGSDSDRGIQPVIRRLLGRLPKEALAGITAAGVKVRVYAPGDQLTDFVEIDLNYLPVTPLP